MSSIDVRLPDGRLIRINGASSDDEARSAVENMLREERSSAPLGGFFENFRRSARGAVGSQVEGAGAIAGELGLPGEQTLRGAGEAISGQPTPGQRGFEGASDFFQQMARRPGETLAAGAGTALGSVAGSMAAPLAAVGTAAVAGAAAPVVAGTGMAAAILSGALSSTNELEELLRSEQVPAERARELATQIGPLIGAAEGGAAGAFLSRLLGRQIRRETAERLAQIAGRSRTNAAARGAGAGVVLEGGSEAAGGAARQAVAAGETGNANLAERLDQVALDAILGSVGGSVPGGVFGSRDPARARAALEAAGRPPEAPPPATPPADAPATIEDETPPPPAPIETPEQARDFFAANREYAPRFPVTDDEAVVLANRMQDQAYAAQVTSLRTDALSRFLGVPAVRTLTERSEDGKESTREVRDAQADQFQQAIVRAAANPDAFFDVGNFSPVDVANVALARFGTETPTSRELGFVRKQLNALRQAGFLTRGEEPGTFAIAPRNLEALRQRAAEQAQRNAMPTRADRREESAGAAEFPALAALATEAGPTAQQQAAADTLATLQGGQYGQLPTEERVKIIARVTQQNAEVGSVFAEYEQNLQQTEAMSRIRQQNPAVAATPEFRTLEQTLASQRAGIMDRLTGMQQLSAIVPPAADPTVTDAPTRGPGSFPGDLSNNPEAMLTAMANANELQRTALFEQLMGDDAAAVAMFQRVTQDLPPRAGMTWKRWQQAFTANNVPFSEAQGRLAYERARALGVINPLGNLVWRPQDTAPRGSVPTVEPVTEPVVEPTVEPAPEPAPPPVEPVTPEIEALLRDYGATQSEIDNYTAWARNPTIFRADDVAFYQTVLRRARSGQMWWAGAVRPATAEILAEAQQGLDYMRNVRAPDLRAKIEQQFAGAAPEERRTFSPIFGSDAGGGTRAEAEARVQSFIDGAANSVARVERQLARNPEASPAPAPARGSVPTVQPEAETESRGDHNGPAFEEADRSEADAVLGDDRSTDVAFAKGSRKRLDGLVINDDGSFDYTYKVNDAQNQGSVTISGELLEDENAAFISVAYGSEHIRGRGYGLQAYQNLIGWAHANGYDLWSDAAVSDQAARVYRALERRGYTVEQSPNAYRSDGGWLSYTPETRRNAEPVFKIPRDRASFALPGTNPAADATDAELTQQGQEAFERVMGANGRLEVRDRLLVRDLAQAVQDAAAAAGISLDSEIAGVAHKDLAVLSLATAREGGAEFPITQAAIHEGWHVAENMRMFTPNEIAILNANLDRIREVVRRYIPSAEIDTQPNHEIRAYGLNARVAEAADFGPLVNRIYDRFVNFLQRIGNFLRGRGFQSWRDVYDAFNAGGMAGRQGQLQARIAASPDIAFANPRLPSSVPAAHQIVKRAQKDQITGVFKWFASPILTMGKVKPALRPAADVMRTLYTRTQEATVDLEQLMGPAARLDAAGRTRVTRAWEQASRTRKKPVTTGMSADEIAALNDMIAAGQRALDFIIESYTMRNFLPNAQTQPAVRARLDAFWQKHEGKHLWEIPPREVAAASPEGFREMQRFERLRNPYYMPMMARGTHFVAAYQRTAGGKEKLVRLVAYTPLNFVQRFRGMPDPEQAAVAELQRQYTGNRFRVTQSGVQFTNDSEASKVREQGDFIMQYLDRLRQTASGQQQNVINQMMNQIDKAQMERIFRPNQDVLQAITPENEGTYLLDAIPQYMLSTAKIQARRYTQDAWTEATRGLSIADAQFLNDLRDYATTPTEAFGSARALAFFMYLGAAFDTAVVNLTQLVQTTMPSLYRDGNAGPHLASAARDTFANKALGKALAGDLSFTQSVVANALKNPDEAAAVIKAMKQGVFNPIFTNESRGQFTAEAVKRVGIKNAEQFAQNANKISNLAGRFMQAVEETNRLTTFLAAYRLAASDPRAIANANRSDNTNLQTPYDYAMHKVFDTQFLTTKEDRAYIQRFTPAAEVATQFLSFPLKMIELYVRSASTMIEGMAKADPFMAKTGAIMLFGMTMPLIGLAGIWALPGADFTRELLERLTSKLWGSTQNFDADMREMLGGGRFAEAVVRGVPHAYSVVGLSRRIAIDPVPADDLFSASTIAMLGPVGGLAEAWLSRMPQYMANGDYVNAAAVISPRAIGNVIRGAGLEMTGEQRTLRGNRIVGPEDIERVDSGSFVPASVRQALGFPAPEFINMREIVTRSEEVNRQVRAPTERVNKELAGYLTRMLDLQRENDMDGAARQLERFRTRVMEVVTEQADRPVDRRINVNLQAIQRRAVNDFYGISSEETLSRAGSRNTRGEILRQRALLDWRNQPQ